MKKAAVFIIIILMLFSFTACDGIISSYIAYKINDNKTKQLTSAVNEYLKNYTLPDNYIFDASSSYPDKDILIDVKNTDRRKEFLYEETFYKEIPTVTGDTTFASYTNAEYFDGKKLFSYDGKTKKTISKTAKWDDFNCEYIPNIIRANLNTIISTANVTGVELEDLREYKLTGGDDLDYNIAISYDEKQINYLKIFDKNVTRFSIFVETNTDVTEFKNFIISLGYDDIDYRITFENAEPYEYEADLKDNFDYIINESQSELGSVENSFGPDKALTYGFDKILKP